jgi:Domain of unknown function (DUF5916)
MIYPGSGLSPTTDPLAEATRWRSRLQAVTPTRWRSRLQESPAAFVVVASCPWRKAFAAFCLAAIVFPFASPSALRADDKPAPARKNALPKRVYTTRRLVGPPPKIDGKLDDPCWTQGEWQGDFIQREPREGQPGSQPTQMKILYDDKYVYVAIRAFDAELARLPRLRGMRDEFIGDIVGVNFDSYFDKRTGFEFDLTSGGSKIDLMLKNDGWDVDWNAVWDGKVGTETNAWTAEFRIPFSQLRYGGQPVQVWGLHCWRWINRHQEESDWQLLPMDSPGLVYSFGELHGIRDLPPSRRIEILPYVLTKYATTAPQEGNPYRQGAKTTADAGLDAKIGLTSNLTADLTVNPDFGQVEADPSQINLTTYETFLAEKRPFFLEGKNIFDYGIDDDVMFYSRRIGQAPAFDAPVGGFTNAPTSTRILGAAKVTGKTPDGLSVGIIQGFTDRAVAEVTENGVEQQQAIAPLTSYTVARVQQDIDKGNTVVGGIVTATARQIHDDALTVLPEHAYTGGFDLLQYWGDRTYFLRLLGIASRVDGSTTAIRTLTLDPVHNYQRPDVSYLGVADGATQLDGTGGDLRIGKDNNGKWRYYGGAGWRSPGLELNDLGYLRTADLVQHYAQLQYFDTDPGTLFRRRDLRLQEIGKYDFGGEFLGQELQFRSDLGFNSNWAVSGMVVYDSEQLDPRVLRGGPAVLVPGSVNTYVAVQTDSSKKKQFKLEFDEAVSQAGNSHYTEIAPTFSARFSDIVNVSAKFSYAHDVEDFQYAGSATVAGANRYIMGRMNQQTLSTTLRFDINLTPELSLSYYGSPFVSTGRFRQFKLVTDPRASPYAARFRRIDATTVFNAASNSYQTSDPSGTFTFVNPDFSWRELNSNLVLRWEYKTGSTVYVVWNQHRSNADLFGGFSAGPDYQRLFGTHPDNTIFVKFNYWFSL